MSTSHTAKGSVENIRAFERAASAVLEGRSSGSSAVLECEDDTRRVLRIAWSDAINGTAIVDGERAPRAGGGEGA